MFVFTIGLFSQTEYADIVLRDTFGKLYSGNKAIDNRLDRCPASLVLDDNEYYVCLGMGQTLTIGFTDNYILNEKDRADLFIKESKNEYKQGYALVYVSADDKTYKYAGKAYDGKITEIDLEENNINDTIRFVKIESYHAQGFDLTWIKGLSNQKVYCEIEDLMNYKSLISTCDCEQIKTYNLNFDYNTLELNAEQEIELDKIVQVMNVFPDLKLKIIGHSDQIGSEEFNKSISERQSKAVYDFLINRDTALSSRLVYAGLGFEKPIHPDYKNKNLDENRRIELWIDK